MLTEDPNKLKSIEIQQIISRLLSCRKCANKEFPISEDEISALCYEVRSIFMTQPMFLQLNPPINICGDIHGQFFDLKEIFKSIGTPTQGKNFLFLGDYVDRGKQSLQCICLLFAYKVLYPQKVFLIRGNHECAELNKIYGFYDECKRRLSLKVWKLFVNVFKCLPVAAVIGDRIFCVHGGLSPYLINLTNINQIIRPVQCEKNTLLNDLLWSDPGNFKGWSSNYQRGTSYCFGQDIVKQFVRKNDFDLICRSHQIAQDGYEFFADKKLITIFSSPNYCSIYDNYGAVLIVNSDMTCHLKQFQKQCIIKLKSTRDRTPEISKIDKVGTKAIENVRTRNTSVLNRQKQEGARISRFLPKEF